MCVCGGMSDHKLISQMRGSANNIPMETGTSTVTHVIFLVGGWSGSDPLPLDLGSEYVQ